MIEERSRRSKSRTPLEEIYDPYQHRRPKRPITTIEAFFLLTKGSIGSGILSAALVFQAGWGTGIINCVFVGLLVTHCLHILISTQYKLCKKLKVPVLSYSQSVRRAIECGPRRFRKIGKYTPFVIDISIVLGQFALCTTYALFVLQTLGFFEEYTHFLNFGLKRYVYCIVLAIPFFFIVFLANWQIVSCLSIIATIISLVAFYILFTFLVTDHHLPMSELEVFGGLAPFPRYFGPILFALEGVAVVAGFENHLESPRTFIAPWGVLNVGMTVVTLLYIMVGGLGYFRYGEYAIGSFLNDLPLTTRAAMWCRALYTLVIYISYGVQGFVLIDILWNKTHRGHALNFKHVARIGLVILSTVIITFVPFIIRTAILDLMFAVSLPILGIVLPAFMEFCLEWPTHHKNRNWILWKDSFLIGIGLTNSVFEIYYCIEQLVVFFSTRDKVIFW